MNSQRIFFFLFLFDTTLIFLRLGLILIDRYTSDFIIIILIFLRSHFYLLLNLFLLLKPYLYFLLFKLFFKFFIFFHLSLFFFFFLHFYFNKVFDIIGLWYHLFNVSFVLNILKNLSFFYSLKVLLVIILKAFSFIHWKQSFALFLSFFFLFLLYSFIYFYQTVFCFWIQNISLILFRPNFNFLLMVIIFLIKFMFNIWNIFWKLLIYFLLNKFIKASILFFDFWLIFINFVKTTLHFLLILWIFCNICLFLLGLV